MSRKANKRVFFNFNNLQRKNENDFQGRIEQNNEEKKKDKDGNNKELNDQKNLFQKTNIISVLLGYLADHADEVKNKKNLISCSNCEGYLNYTSKILGYAEYLNQQEKEQKQTEKQDSDLEDQDSDLEDEEQEDEINEEKEDEKEDEKETEKEQEQEQEKEQEKEKEKEKEEEVFLDKNDLKESDHFWVCEYCHHTNVLKNFSKNLNQNQEMIVDYLIEEAITKNSNQEKETITVFCIDISGSMSQSSKVKDGELDLSKFGKQKQTNHSYYNYSGRGLSRSGYRNQRYTRQSQMQEQPNVQKYVTRLQCLQIAVGNQLEELSRTSPNSKVVIVTFNGEVTIQSNGIDQEIVINPNELDDIEKLKEIGANYNLTQTIQQSSGELIDKLYSLKENGCTALGPGVLVSIAIASQVPGSKVVLCTDGLSNVGYGKFEGLNSKENNQNTVAEQYDSISQYGKKSSIVIDLITLENTDCNIEQIGKLSNLTGGTIDIVKPTQLSTRFTNIMSNPVVATNVSVELLFHTSLYAFDDDDRKVGSRLEKEVGNVTKDLELTFNYGVKENINKKILNLVQGKIPYQIRLNYHKLDGSKWLRTISEHLEVAENFKDALEELDYGLMNQNFMQKAGKFAIKGNIEESSRLLKEQQDFYQGIQKLPTTKENSLQENIKQFDTQSSEWEKVLNKKKSINEKNKKSKIVVRTEDKISSFLFNSINFSQKKKN
ncbi:hypothetical protein M0812_10178 [Anaeramoeba flamelloides]|uniref:VWFA domain-containing protein n=1 Tax=Anaeramoeba flamelloides TaxID=1746091 RepID=A0AAV7ZWK8_9EUKA|nr:hypothetical protein M0812_10178 [Anaeramoeba flamelloides]